MFIAWSTANTHIELRKVERTIVSGRASDRAIEGAGVLFCVRQWEGMVRFRATADLPATRQTDPHTTHMPNQDTHHIVT